MNGIENITKKIEAETQEKVAAILFEAEQQAKAITDDVAQRIANDVVGVREVIHARVADVAQKAEQAAALERRKILAAERQSLIKESFEKSLQTLLNLPEEEYFKLLLTLTEKAVFDGEGGEILLNARDRERFGDRLVAKLNANIVADRFEGAKKLVTGAVERIFSGELAAVSRLAENRPEFERKKVSLAEESVDIVGGVIIRRGRVELNCALDAIIRMLSLESASIVLEALFPEGA